MKYLVVLVVVLIGIWLWRSSRQAPKAGRDASRQAGQQQEMVRCPVCALHVPKAEAVAGRQAWYCCVEHRQRAEG
ncbi:MAG: PP0621 family protein [Burkholderiaceae bacterium]